jgi:hypothetical protein
MIKSLAIIFTVIVFNISVLTQAFGISITYDYILDAGNDPTTAEPYATVWDFNGASLATPPAFILGVSQTGGGASVVNGTTASYASPLNDTTDYLAVPINGAPGSVTFDFGNEYNYFGLYWGSIDSFNRISFYDSVGLVITLTGNQLPTPVIANGSQVSDLSNLYVNFFFGDKVFEKVKFTSTSKAYELDNIAFGNTPVPEPATMLLFGAGVLGIVGSRLKKRK